MKAKLIVVGGKAKSTVIDLKLPAIIGRGKKSTVLLPHPLVSREHCELFELDGKLIARDLKSLNGTYIGNQPITESVINPGELLTVGTVTFRAVYGDLVATSPDKPIEILTNSSGETVIGQEELEESMADGSHLGDDSKGGSPGFVETPESLAETSDIEGDIEGEGSDENLPEDKDQEDGAPTVSPGISPLLPPKPTSQDAADGESSVSKEIESSGHSHVLASVEQEEDATSTPISSSVSNESKSYSPLEGQDKHSRNKAEEAENINDDDAFQDFLNDLN